jgi:hypothetical protein
MKLTKDQQKELKKIESTMEKINKLSASKGFDLDEVVLAYNSGAPDITIIDREKQILRSRSRQEAFRRSQQKQQEPQTTKKVKVLVNR